MKWPSWVNVVLGIWLFIAPWVLRYGNRTAASASVIVGIVVFIIALWSATASLTVTGPAWANAILGIWSIISPWALRFHTLTSAMANDVIIGLAILILAIIRISSVRALPVGGPPPSTR
jgi:hypothetical protein